TLGVSIAIDDFGTGYSSLAYLQRLPIDTLKVDKAFVRELSLRPSHVSIAAAIVSRALSMGLKGAAEGVETDVQYQHLIALGCTEFQGYLFSKPELAPELERGFRHGCAIPWPGSKQNLIVTKHVSFGLYVIDGSGETSEPKGEVWVS